MKGGAGRPYGRMSGSLLATTLLSYQATARLALLTLPVAGLPALLNRCTQLRLCYKTQTVSLRTQRDCQGLSY